MQPFLIGLTVAGAVAIGTLFLRLGQLLQTGLPPGQRATPAFVADPKNRTSVIVRGWTYDELAKIIAYFLSSYELPDATTTVTARSDSTLVIRFPNDIQPEHLFYLVNYIQYPKGFDLTHRSIGVVAHIVLGPVFPVPDASLTGRGAIVYVPANDKDFDLVYAKAETGQAYRISFTDLAWQPVDDPRVPASVSGL